MASEWNSWGAWESCSVTCGGGQRNRTRTCTHDGLCTGNDWEMEACNPESCPGTNRSGQHTACLCNTSILIDDIGTVYLVVWDIDLKVAHLIKTRVYLFSVILRSWLTHHITSFDELIFYLIHMLFLWPCWLWINTACNGQVLLLSRIMWQRGRKSILLWHWKY